MVEGFKRNEDQDLEKKDAGQEGIDRKYSDGFGLPNTVMPEKGEIAA